MADTFIKATEHQNGIIVNVYAWTDGGIYVNADPKNAGHIGRVMMGGTPTAQAINWYDEETKNSKDKHLLIFITDGSSGVTLSGMKDPTAEGKHNNNDLTMFGKAVMDKIRERKSAVFGVMIGHRKEFIENIFDSDSAIVSTMEEAREHIEKRFRATVEDYVKSI